MMLNLKHKFLVLFIIVFFGFSTYFVSAEDLYYCIHLPALNPVLCNFNEPVHLQGFVEYNWDLAPIDYVPYTFSLTTFADVPKLRVKIREWDLYECLPDFDRKAGGSGLDFVEYVFHPSEYSLFLQHDYISTIHLVIYNSQGNRIRMFNSPNGFYSTINWWNGSAHKPQPFCNDFYPPPPNDDE